ncbi:MULTISPECIES: aliphatic sulfonate ABC transporter substrate-binding protein [Bacillaceae]|uniref:Sulfonate transport system substrate-binding protein n=1 Tax=Peribacillus huizhouensis TaxID=1501239 RepID=A0ABR6CTE0_9BACI|nr:MULTISPECIES: aliphatic sulfonate ABC transporter substrate-binding protein [Bacillaceae]MBA9028292.1 sulfonate transport system substrate-binding protein [Peribacillus huizhouensis]
MKIKRNLFSFISLMIVLAVALAGCGSSPNSDKTSGQNENGSSDKIIRMGYQKGNTINILKESGILEEKLKEKGYTVEWKEFVHGNAVVEGLVTKNIDFGHAADGAGIYAQAGNKPLVYVGADLPNPEGVGVLVHKDSGLTSIKDLKGKKIGVLQGGNHHYLAVLALEEAGISAEDVEWVYLNDAAQGRTAFETNKIDVLASYDPFLAGTEIDLETINLTEGKDYGYPNRTFYYTNEEFNQEHPELVELILAATDESDKWANENKPEVVKLVSKMLGIDEAIIAKAIERREYGVNKINEEIIAAQQKQADVYYELGLIPAKIDVAEYMPIN